MPRNVISRIVCSTRYAVGAAYVHSNLFPQYATSEPFHVRTAHIVVPSRRVKTVTQTSSGRMNTRCTPTLAVSTSATRAILTPENSNRSFLSLLRLLPVYQSRASACSTLNVRSDFLRLATERAYLPCPCSEQLYTQLKHAELGFGTVRI